MMDVDAGYMYRPKTRETREAYEALLAVIQQQFGEQPQVSAAQSQRARHWTAYHFLGCCAVLL